MSNKITTTWATDNHLFAVLLSSHDAYAWVMNNYIQLIYVKSPDNPSVRFLPWNKIETWYKCEYAEIQIINIDFIKMKWSSINSFIIDSINNGWYVQLVLDQFYIRASNRFGHIHSAHNNLFYGYERSSEVFYMSDNFNMGKYSFETTQFNDVIAAFKSVINDNNQNFVFDNKDTAVLLKLNSHKYSFNIQLLLDYLRDYLDSKNSFKTFRDYEFTNLTYGINVLDCLMEYIEDIYVNHTNWINHTLFTMLRDHKQLMLLRLEYIQKSIDLKTHNLNFNNLILSYVEIFNTTVIILNLAIKYNVTQNKSILMKIVAKLTDVKLIETNAIRDLIDIMSLI